MKKLIVLSAFSAALTMAAGAQAATMTYQFTATISSIVEGIYSDAPVALSSASVVGGSVALGDTVNGIFSYDTATAPFLHYDSPYGSQASYEGGTLSVAFSGKGPSVGTSPATYTDVIDQAPGSGSPDGVTVHSYTYDYSGEPTQRTLILGLNDDTGSLLENTALPGGQLTQFNSKTFAMEDLRAVNGIFSGLRVSGEITSFRAVSPVPEPSMFVGIMASLGLLAWRRKRSS